MVERHVVGFNMERAARRLDLILGRLWQLRFVDHSLVGLALRLRTEAHALRASLEDVCLHPLLLFYIVESLVAAWTRCGILLLLVSVDPAGELTCGVLLVVNLTRLNAGLLGQRNQSLLREHPIILNLPRSLQDGHLRNFLDEHALSGHRCLADFDDIVETRVLVQSLSLQTRCGVSSRQDRLRGELAVADRRLHVMACGA